MQKYQFFFKNQDITNKLCCCKIHAQILFVKFNFVFFPGNMVKISEKDDIQLEKSRLELYFKSMQSTNNQRNIHYGKSR